MNNVTQLHDYQGFRQIDLNQGKKSPLPFGSGLKSKS
ncbi:MAG: hypothetical protein JWQ21_1913 [Herminiimonas sp.]|nr:hypothetical protein [Herminiimonas sp.]